VLRNGEVIEIETRTIQLGEVVLICPGSKIPVDGDVVRGHSFVEQVAITGEPMPSEKSVCSYIYAGILNQAGTLQVSMRLGGGITFVRRKIER